MADALTGSTYVRPARERRVGGHSMQRLLVAVIILLSVAVAAELLYHLVIGPQLTVETILIDSDIPGVESELLAAAGLSVGMAWFDVEPRTVAERIERHPRVRQAVIERVFPNSGRIHIAARVPLAVAVARTDEGSVLLVVDEEGVVLGTGRDLPAGDLPIISGLRFAAAEPGLRLPPLVVEFLQELRALKLKAPELFNLFSEYRVVRVNDYAYEAVLYPMHFPVPVRVGTRISEEMIQYIMMMLDILQRDGRLASLVELDFRTGEGVLRFRADEGGHG